MQVKKQYVVSLMAVTLLATAVSSAQVRVSRGDTDPEYEAGQAMGVSGAGVKPSISRGDTDPEYEAGQAMGVSRKGVNPSVSRGDTDPEYEASQAISSSTGFSVVVHKVFGLGAKLHRAIFSLVGPNSNTSKQQYEALILKGNNGSIVTDIAPIQR